MNEIERLKKALALCLDMAESGYENALSAEAYGRASYFRETLDEVEKIITREEIMTWRAV